MKYMWNKMKDWNIRTEWKNTLFILITVITVGAAGALTWLLLGRLFLQDITWFYCFTGYPAFFIGLLGAVLYLYRHEF